MIVRDPIVRNPGWVLAAVLALSAGCGGGGESQSTSGSAPAAHSGTVSTSYQPGPPAAAPGGAFGGFSGGGSSGGSGGHPHLGGLGGALHDRIVRQRELTARQHMGPERLDGMDPDQRRTADWQASTSSSHPVTSPQDDDCDRLWAQHVATTESYHARRQDGLHSATSAARERAFLAQCRDAPPAARQCMDRDYLAAHAEECQQMRDTVGAQAHRQIHGAGSAPLPSFDGHGI